jgi:hypothetical protein
MPDRALTTWRKRAGPALAIAFLLGLGILLAPSIVAIVKDGSRLDRSLIGIAFITALVFPSVWRSRIAKSSPAERRATVLAVVLGGASVTWVSASDLGGAILGALVWGLLMLAAMRALVAGIGTSRGRRQSQ